MWTSVWPWVAVAAAGALHGLNPMAGWAFAAWPAGGAARVWRRLAAVAVGHLLSVLAVAAAVPAALQLGLAFEPLWLQGAAALLLVAAAAHHFPRRAHRPSASGAAALALWSFIVGIGHGAGWMLMPALASLCGGGIPGREITASGSLVLALAAVGLHAGAMLGTAAAMAAGTRRALGWWEERAGFPAARA